MAAVVGEAEPALLGIAAGLHSFRNALSNKQNGKGGTTTSKFAATFVFAIFSTLMSPNSNCVCSYGGAFDGGIAGVGGSLLS